MPIKLPPSDDTALNMTPMIDIVFNLVTFFMLTLDLSRKELAALDLPRANQGIEDKDSSLKLLKKKLQVLGADPRLKEKDGSSKVMVLVRGDRGAKWMYIQWIMQICAEQKIYKIHFGVEGPPKEQR